MCPGPPNGESFHYSVPKSDAKCQAFCLRAAPGTTGLGSVTSLGLCRAPEVLSEPGMGKIPTTPF